MLFEALCGIRESEHVRLSVWYNDIKPSLDDISTSPCQFIQPQIKEESMCINDTVEQSCRDSSIVGVSDSSNIISSNQIKQETLLNQLTEANIYQEYVRGIDSMEYDSIEIKQENEDYSHKTTPKGMVFKSLYIIVLVGLKPDS